jgi:hypothetical protein
LAISKRPIAAREFLPLLTHLYRGYVSSRLGQFTYGSYFRSSILRDLCEISPPSAVKMSAAGLVERTPLHSENYFAGLAFDEAEFSAVFSAPPFDSRVRCGKNGVISNSIFSRELVKATGLALDSST